MIPSLRHLDGCVDGWLLALAPGRRYSELYSQPSVGLESSSPPSRFQRAMNVIRGFVLPSREGLLLAWPRADGRRVRTMEQRLEQGS